MSALTVVGGSIAALVAADAAARAGRPVDLLVPPGGVGGGFGGIERDGRRLDLGVRLFELDREDAGPAPDLAAYRPGPEGHAPFIRLVADWMGELVNGALRTVAPPEMLVDGRRVDDIYFTVDLDGLDRVVPAEAPRIAAEAAAARDGLGPAGVLADRDALEAMSLADASLANHGGTFHRRFIAPMCAKIHPGGADAVGAARRRKVWMPLFHPATLANAAAGAPTGYAPHRPFSTVAPGGSRAVVDALMARLRAAGARVRTVPAVTGLERRPGGVTRMRFADGSQVEARRPVLGAGPGELFAAAGAAYAPPRVRMAIAWVEVPEHAVAARPGLVHLPDPGIPAFRLSPGDGGRPGHALFTVELRHDIADGDMDAAAVGALRASGVVDAGAGATVVHRVAAPAFVDPSPAAEREFAEARAALDLLGLDAEVVGGAAAFGADSFNEQVVQGLRAQEATA